MIKIHKINMDLCYLTYILVGPLIGKRLQKLHEEKGIHFILGAEVTELHGDEDDNLSEVVLNSGQTLRADLLLAGLGVLPCTDFIRGSNIKLNSKGYVPVDEVIMVFLRTATNISNEKRIRTTLSNSWRSQL